tara:strand:+ start:5028 stop:5546 length:519 start_codon:yes stop_codon:yes gene_type:complete
MEENLEVHTISRIDVLKGRSSINTDGLADLLLEHFDHRLGDDPATSLYEDSFCPDSPLIDSIVEELKESFYRFTGIKINLLGKWSQIHKPNMSTNSHAHYPADVASVYYVSVPDGAGHICFYPDHNKYHPNMVKFQPEKNTFLMFPATLEHSVTRNLSTDDRISLSFNFSLC